MNASETELLARADRMSDSSLVSLSDWELAQLRLAMLHLLQEITHTPPQQPTGDHHAQRCESTEICKSEHA